MEDRKFDKARAARGIAMRSGTVVAAVVFALFFFSDDPTLAGFSPALRLGLTIFFLMVTVAGGWLYFRKRDIS